MKQTAVEWLRNLYENQPAYEEHILDEHWEKALEMERMQLTEARAEAAINAIQGIVDEYNETINTN